jgi:penicillin-binding protein 1B
VDVQLDKSTNLLATPACPQTYTAAFIAGTEPNQTCDQPVGVKGFFSRILGLGEKPLPPPAPGGTQAIASPGTVTQDANATEQDGKKKKGFFGKIAGIFKDDKQSNPPPNPPVPAGNGPQ